MNRRRFLVLSGAGALMLAQPAFAQDYVARIVRQLERLGYDQITVSRTLLGRQKILGEGPKGTREVIINPATGEILRDLIRRSGKSGSNGGDLLDDHGGDDDDDDEDEDEDKDGDGDGDNSGHGSGNSGSGGGDGEEND